MTVSVVFNSTFNTEEIMARLVTLKRTFVEVNPDTRK